MTNLEKLQNYALHGPTANQKQFVMIDLNSMGVPEYDSESKTWTIKKNESQGLLGWLDDLLFSDDEEPVIGAEYTNAAQGGWTKEDYDREREIQSKQKNLLISQLNQIDLQNSNLAKQISAAKLHEAEYQRSKASINPLTQLLSGYFGGTDFGVERVLGSDPFKNMPYKYEFRSNARSRFRDALAGYMQRRS